MSLALRWRAWHGDELFGAEFPPRFGVAVYRPGDGADIGAAGVRHAFANPIGSPRIAELARGKRSAIVVVDDIARPTPASRVIPPILEELRAGGIPEGCIRFLMAVGCHRAMTRGEMARKLGEDVVERFQTLTVRGSPALWAGGNRTLAGGL